VIDASVLLHHIFNEEEFRPKIQYFVNVIRKEEIPCEVLPLTTYEVNKRITEAATEFSKVLSSCRTHTEKIASKSLSELKIDRKLAYVLERAFSETFEDISKKHCRRRRQKTAKIRNARIIEFAVMMEFWNALSGSRLNMEQFFENLKDSLGERYREFCLKQSTLMEEIGASTIDQPHMLQTTKTLANKFSKRCKIRNSNDVNLLCQAVGRMYETDKWCVVVTTDYGDMVKNDSQIRHLTLLTVCDPLYVVYRLDSKLDLALKPKSAATKFKIRFAEFFKPTKPAGVV